MVTPIPGLDIVTISGRKTKAFAAPLRPGVDVLRVMSIKTGPGPWTTAPLPFDIGANYQQAVNPYAWARCATYLASIYTTDNRAPAALASLFEAVQPFIENGSFLFRFDKTFASAAEPLRGPWRSALGNAYIMMGALEAWRVTQDQHWGDLAHSLLMKLVLAPTDTDIVNLDASSWLWLQEYPELTRVNGTRVRTGVLNGHVGALFGLYHWLQTAGTDSTIDLHVRAAAATAATYYSRTRNPGATMDYWLFDKTPDYGPVRAVNFASALAQITGNTIFTTLRDAFLTDVNVSK